VKSKLTIDNPLYLLLRLRSEAVGAIGEFRFPASTESDATHITIRKIVPKKN
jgi:hypothetical protein